MADSPMQVRRAELLEDLVAQVEVILGDLGIADDIATHAGHALADHLADHWGGQIINYPKDAHHRLCQREIQILADRAAGATIAQLSRRYDMTERGVYKLISRAESRQVDSAQSDLPFPE